MSFLRVEISGEFLGLPSESLIQYGMSAFWVSNKNFISFAVFPCKKYKSEIKVRLASVTGFTSPFFVFLPLTPSFFGVAALWLLCLPEGICLPLCFWAWVTLHVYSLKKVYECGYKRGEESYVS